MQRPSIRAGAARLAATLAIAVQIATAGALGLVATSGARAHEVQLKDLKIVPPYTKEPAAGVTDVTVSMTIRNAGSKPERLLAAGSPLAREARIATDGGPIEIPPGGSIKLSAGGAHIRLIGLTEPLTGYEMFPLWLTFAHAGRVEVEVMVEENDNAADGPAAADNKTHPTHGDHK